MRPIRVVLGHMPHLLRDIVVEVIGSECDMQVIGEADEAGEMTALFKCDRTEVLVLAADAAAPLERDSNLLYEHRGLRVLVLSNDGRVADLHWLEPQRRSCTDVSPAGLLRLIRAVRGETNDCESETTKPAARGRV